MQLSSDFCRSQQTIHQERAASTQLDNVRIVAGKAAAAWGVEAAAAELREKRRASGQGSDGSLTRREMEIGDDEE